MAEIEPERRTLSDGTPVVIRTTAADDASETVALFRSVVDEGLCTVQMPSEVRVTDAEEREYVEADRENPGSLCLVAAHLLSALTSWARHHPGIEKLGLYGFSTNAAAAISIYQRHGFVIEGRYPRDMKLEDGSCVDTVAMGLPVKPRPAKGEMPAHPSGSPDV